MGEAGEGEDPLSLEGGKNFLNLERLYVYFNAFVDEFGTRPGGNKT